MRSHIILISLFLACNVNSQDCGYLPSNLPAPIKNLLSPPPYGFKCGCPETSCLCGLLPPTVPPCGCYNPAIGLQNPVIGVQTCGCTSCSCGSSVIGNLCGCSTPTVGLATTCGCDPSVRIVDGCPRCQPVYSYNLPSIGYPTCGCGCGYGGVVTPSYLPPCGCPGYGCGCGFPYNCGCASCGCVAPTCGCVAPTCGCAAPSCGCAAPTCGCVAPTCGCAAPSCGCAAPCGCGYAPCGCAPVNACGCVEVPCGLPKVKTTCTCVTPSIETPYGCAQGKPTCACATTFEMPTCGLPVVPPFAPVLGCSRYLRQVCVQPPFL